MAHTNFRGTPKAKSSFPKIVAKGEQLRHQPPKPFNPQARVQMARNLQRFSGKRGN